MPCPSPDSRLRPTNNQELAPDRELKVSDLGKLEVIASLEDGEQVSIRLGEQQTDSAYGSTATFRPSKPRGHIPGTKVSFPAVHFLSRETFDEMADRLGGDQSEYKIVAWFDPSANAIEIPIPTQAGELLPKELGLSGRAVKELVASYFHELVHVAGGNEFLAYMKQSEIEVQLGLRSEAWGPVEILDHISKSYGHEDLIAAQIEFEDWAMANGEKGLLRQHYEALEARMARMDAESFPELDGLLDDVA